LPRNSAQLILSGSVTGATDFRARSNRAQTLEFIDLAQPADSNVEKSLLERVGKGDAHAVAECIDHFGGLVWSLARRLAVLPSEAEDAVQEVFVELWKSAARYDPSVASETTFVAMIARRRLIDRRRRTSRRPNGNAADVDDLPIRAAPDEHDRVELADEVARATEAMQQLRPEQQEVLNLSVCQGWSHQRIAERLCLPLGTVKTHVRRGLMRVRELLEADAQDGRGGTTL
jgi:RNA polymerase sigma-70 factor (ECF subfamily)